VGPDTGLVGTIVAERYDLIELIGAGGMGDVYRAHDHELDEEVALKVVRDALVRVPGVLERFRAEVKLARRVTHRNVARTYELGRTDTLTYFTMELVAGESLTDRMRAGPLRRRRCRRPSRSSCATRWPPRTRSASSTAISSPTTC
jgi:serine/threonine protein kinase